MLSYLPYPKVTAAVGSGFLVYPEGEPHLMSVIMTKCVWSPILWKGGVRTEKNFIMAKYAALDFENPDVTLDGAIRSFCDMWHIIGVTRNHQKAKGGAPPRDRFRVLLKFEKPITDIKQYRLTLYRLARRHGSDEACVDGARLFFPCTGISSIECGQDALFEEVPELPQESDEDREDKFKKIAAFHYGYRGVSSYCLRWLNNVIPQGSRSVTCFKLGKELCRAGIAYENAIKFILASPTYREKAVDHETHKKILSQVWYGYKAVEKEGDKGN